MLKMTLAVGVLLSRTSLGPSFQSRSRSEVLDSNTCKLPAKLQQSLVRQLMGPQNTEEHQAVTLKKHHTSEQAPAGLVCRPRESAEAPESGSTAAPASQQSAARPCALLTRRLAS